MNVTSLSKIPFSEIELPHLVSRVRMMGLAPLDAGQQELSATEWFNKLVAMMNADLQLRMSTRAEITKQEGQKIQDGVPSGWEFEFEVTFDEQRWIFDKPTMAMRTQTWSFDWPELRGKEASFDLPDGLEWRTEHRYLGDFFQCRSITDCGWYPVYTDIPVAILKTKRVIFTVPEVVSQRKEFKWDVPEFYNEQVVWYVKIPQFKLIHSAATYAEESEKKAAELTTKISEGTKQDVAEIRSIYKDELLHAAAAVASETREKMTKEYNVNLGLFNGAIEGMQAQIAALPETERVKYQESLNTWISNRQAFIDQYLQFMQNIDAQIQVMVQKVLESLGAAAGL